MYGGINMRDNVNWFVHHVAMKIIIQIKIKKTKPERLEMKKNIAHVKENIQSTKKRNKLF